MLVDLSRGERKTEASKHHTSQCSKDKQANMDKHGQSMSSKFCLFDLERIAISLNQVSNNSAFSRKTLFPFCVYTYHSSRKSESHKTIHG